ncbi:MAG TPA: SCP2 sterol-binding domain-containing protein [Bdellovibrionota bacterium]|jgi:putative sterol carrier protein|nr:SCP2 sterol-binding domain-containing protein [Bdellovibrionota bacterium]
MNAKDIFDTLLPKKLEANPSLFASLGLKNEGVRLELDGAQGGDWTISFDASGTCRVQKNAGGGSCHIQMSDENFEKLLSGKLNVPMALMTRKIKVNGDKGLALKVGEGLRTALR